VMKHVREAYISMSDSAESTVYSERVAAIPEAASVAAGCTVRTTCPHHNTLATLATRIGVRRINSKAISTELLAARSFSPLNNTPLRLMFSVRALCQITSPMERYRRGILVLMRSARKVMKYI
jgi:hypothetical protein